jgi:uncharacterized small protein (DUF1192 family)
MDWEEPKRASVKGIAVGDDLQSLSVAELEARIAALSREIDRVRKEIETKKAHEAAAAAVFKG